jgi:hypothetical protein
MTEYSIILLFVGLAAYSAIFGFRARLEGGRGQRRYLWVHRSGGSLRALASKYSVRRLSISVWHSEASRG